METMTEKNTTARAKEIDAALKGDGLPAIGDADVWREALGFANVAAIWRAIRRGDLQGFKLGNRWRVRRGAVALFIAKREARS